MVEAAERDAAKVRAGISGRMQKGRGVVPSLPIGAKSSSGW